MRKKFKKVLSLLLVSVILCTALFTGLTVSAAEPSSVGITGVRNISWSFSDGGSSFTVRRQSHKTTDGRTPYCIQPSVTSSPGINKTVNYVCSGTIGTYNMAHVSERTAPSADFIRSLLYYADLYCGKENLSDAGFMGVQLAIHKYPVSTWARATKRVPYNKDSFNPLAEINANGAGYSAQSIAISYAEALTYKAQNNPISNGEASVSLVRTGGGYISGGNYIVATYTANGSFDSCSFWTEGSAVNLATNGNTCTLYYPLSAVPSSYDIALKVGVSRSTYEVYIYTSGGLQDMAIGGSGSSYREDLTYEASGGKTGIINIYKKDASNNTLLTNGKFKVTNQNSGAVYYGITNSNGQVIFEGLPYGYYTVEEIGAPEGYYIGKDENGNLNKWTDIALTASNTTVTLTAYNLKQSGRIKVIKTDSETGNTPQGEAMLTGGVFEISNDNGVVETLTMSETNEATSGLLPLGKYYIKETVAPNGYNLNSEVKEVELTAADQSVLYVNGEANISDDVIKGTVSIHKTGEDIYTEEGKTVNLKGAVFTVYNKNNEEVAVMTTDENGKATSPSLPYGNYIVKETSVPEGYRACSDFEVRIDENKDYSFELTDAVYKSQIKIIKKDKTTGKTINLSETEFKIENEKGETVKIGNKDKFTTSNGILTLSKKLTYGKYKLIETKAPSGYLLDNEVIPFTVDENSGDIITVEKKDTPLMGKIKIEKTGSAFVETEKTVSEYGEMNLPVFKEMPLTGVVFEVLAAEDIRTSDGTLRYAKGDVATEVTTVDGKVTTKNLFPGKYIIKEKETVAGYKLDETEYHVTVVNDGRSEVSIGQFDLFNERSKTQITLVKEAKKWINKSNEENNTVTRTLEVLPGEGFVFGLYAAENIKAYSGDILIEKDDLITIGTTDENGNLEFDIDVPFAKYYVKELHAPEIHFNLSNKKYDIDLTTEKTDGSVVVDGITEPILNDFDKYEVKINKKDLTTGEAVAGALIEISDEDGNVIYRDYTGEDGTVPDVVLEPGKYTFKEVLAPNGYALNTSVFEFEVKEDGTIEGDTEIADDYTRFKVIKTDESGNPLKGVGFGLFDENGNLVSEVFTDENGIAEFVGFSTGKYDIKETKELDGYIKTSKPVATIENNGTYLNDENVQKVEVTNNKIPVSPRTGDSTPVVWLAVLAILSSASVGFFLLKIKKENGISLTKEND